MHDILLGLRSDWLWLDKRIDVASSEIEEISRTKKNGARVMTVSGIGPMISTAMVAAIGRGEEFDRGRDFAAWIDLVPGSTAPAARANDVLVLLWRASIFLICKGVLSHS